jgi:hypothetical protein
VTNTKTCGRCLKTKDLTDFQEKWKGTGIYKSYCKACEYELYGPGKAVNRKRHALARQKFLQQVKESFGCQICGETCHLVLDFHHLEQDAKEKHLSGMAVDNRPWNVIIAELEKCAVLCCNCHRKVHGNLLPDTLLQPVTMTEELRTLAKL